MAQEVIAIICDCDGTLCPDTTDKLMRELGLARPNSGGGMWTVWWKTVGTTPLPT